MERYQDNTCLSNTGSTKAGIGSYCVAFALVTAFFFHQYSSIIPGITIGELFLIAGSIIILYKKKGQISTKYTRMILVIYIVSLVLSCISILAELNNFTIESSFEVFSRWIRYFSYAVFYILYCENFDGIKLVLRIYRVFCLIVSIYTILQFIIYLVFHFYLPFDILPFLPRERSLSSEWLYSYSNTYSFRAYGIFDEPAYLTEYLLPGLVLALYGIEKEKRDWVNFILISVAILLSTSVQGIVMMFVAIALFLFDKRSRRLISFNNIMLLVVIVVLIIIFATSDIFNSVISRIGRIGNVSSGDYSIKLRLYRGFALWSEFPLFKQVFGVGIGNTANYCAAHNLTTVYDFYTRSANSLESMSGISKILVENGIICFVLFISFIVNLFRKSSFLSKVLIILFLLMLFSGSGLFTIEGVFYMFFIVVTHNYTKNNIL